MKSLPLAYVCSTSGVSVSLVSLHQESVTDLLLSRSSLALSSVEFLLGILCLLEKSKTRFYEITEGSWSSGSC